MQDKFEDIYDKWSSNLLSCEEASQLLHCSIRTFHRKRIKYQQGGFEDILDKRIGSTPHNKIPIDKVTKILSLRQEYEDYNILHLQLISVHI